LGAEDDLFLGEELDGLVEEGFEGERLIFWEVCGNVVLLVVELGNEGFNLGDFFS